MHTLLSTEREPRAEIRAATAPLSLSAGSDDPAHAAARVGVITSIGYGVCGPPLIGALADRTEPTIWPRRPGGQTAR
ncbi:hypothetical protein [Streptomyces coeruleorubidus]|uniref:hypothetical protein n=1 Tax=Streptomyces coeruleorubidus TaxID=116188 RepID=UPI00366A326B